MSCFGSAAESDSSKLLPAQKFLHCVLVKVIYQQIEAAFKEGWPSLPLCFH